MRSTLQPWFVVCAISHTGGSISLKRRKIITLYSVHLNKLCSRLKTTCLSKQQQGDNTIDSDGITSDRVFKWKMVWWQYSRTPFQTMQKVVNRLYAHWNGPVCRQIHAKSVHLFYLFFEVWQRNILGNNVINKFGKKKVPFGGCAGEKADSCEICGHQSKAAVFNQTARRVSVGIKIWQCDCCGTER